MKHYLRARFSRLAVPILALAFLAAVAPARAEEGFHRAQKFEVFSVGQWQSTGKASSFKFANNFGGGLGLGYNITDHFNVNTDVIFSKVNLAQQTGTVTLDSSHIAGHVNLDYNIFAGPLTPFLTGGLGVDSYDGSNGLTKISQAELAYKVGAGLRWDINKSIFAKAMYRAAWADIRNAENFHTISLALGVTF